MKKLSIRPGSGAAGPTPIFNAGESGNYHFNTYGSVHKNFRQWENVHGFGMCGIAGHTSDIELLAESIADLNRQNIIAICDPKVTEDLKRFCEQKEITLSFPIEEAEAHP